MMMNSRIADLVRDNEPESITDAIEEGAFFDMQSFTKALIDQVVSGDVDKEVAANAATNRHDFIVTLERALKQQGADLRVEENKQKRDQEPPEQPERQEPQEELPALRLAQAGD
jgi:Tfp pilus assembly ATPase PilU